MVVHVLPATVVARGKQVALREGLVVERDEGCRQMSKIVDIAV